MLTDHRLEQRRVLSFLLLMVPMTLLMVPMTLMLTVHRSEKRRVLSFLLLIGVTGCCEVHLCGLLIDHWFVITPFATQNVGYT
jgi:ABC-type glycerol-3-phosphate transport system permease component